MIVVRKDGKILVLKRSGSDFRRPECWDFPGGNFEQGEDVMESARREVMEETSLKIGDLKPIYVESARLKNQNGADVIALCYVTKKFEGEIKLSYEHMEYRWVKPEEFLEKFETGDDRGFLKNALRRAIEFGEVG